MGKRSAGSVKAEGAWVNSTYYRVDSAKVLAVLYPWLQSAANEETVSLSNIYHAAEAVR